MNIKKAIPSFITCCNLACGFAVFLIDPQYGIYLIIAGAIFDLFDGAAARSLGVTGEFGAQLDSLADMVTFGAAPAFLIANLLPAPYHFISILIVVAAALRLAKFNVSGGDSYYFKGLATPSSAFFYIALILAIDWYSEHQLYILIPAIIIISLLNVSVLKMFSFKGLKKDKWTSPFLIIVLAIALIMSFIDYKIALIIAMLSYVILSVVYHFLMSKVSESV